MTWRCWSLLPILLLAQSLGYAQDRGASAEVRIKAAFLYKFSAFIEWPPGSFARSDSAFVIGVVGADTLADELTRVVAQREVDGRPVEVRKLGSDTALDGVQMLFVGGREAARLALVLAAARGRPTLTVTESEDGLPPGSVINFVLVNDKVRFDVALPAADAGNLRISSRLLAVARKVLGGAS